MSAPEMVQFVITGEFITRQARAFWSEEGEHKRALELLECMDGITHAQCLDILEGRAKLVGDSKVGVTLEADNTQMPSLLDVLSKLREERDEAREDRADMYQMYNGDTALVGSPTGGRTVPLRKTQRAFSGYRTLKEGYDWEGNGGPNDVEPRIYRESEVFKRAEKSSETPTQAPEPKRVAPVASESITSSNGWLSPKGEFYSCSYGGHNQLMWDLDLEEDVRTKENWIKLQGRDGEDHIFPADYDMVSTAQKAAVLKYCFSRKIEVPWWVKEENARDQQER